MSGNGQNILVRMINQIGTFFEDMPDRKEAMQDLVGHIKRSWAVSMRTDFFAYVDAHGYEEIHPVAAEAVQLHRAYLTAPSAM